jgi:hypothetical protein
MLLLLLLLLLRWPAGCIESLEVMQLVLPAGQRERGRHSRRSTELRSVSTSENNMAAALPSSFEAQQLLLRANMQADSTGTDNSWQETLVANIVMPTCDVLFDLGTAMVCYASPAKHRLA